MKGLEISQCSSIKILKYQNIKTSYQSIKISISKYPNIKMSKHQTSKHQNIKLYIKTSKHQNIKTSKHQNIKLSKYQNIKISKYQNIKISKYQNIGRFKNRTFWDQRHMRRTTFLRREKDGVCADRCVERGLPTPMIWGQTP